MSTLLRGQLGHISVTNRTWRRALELASMFGWEPMGTAAPELPEGYGPYGDGDWNGKYCSHDGQRILEPDAKAIATALEKAMLHASDHECWLCGPAGKKLLQEFIDHCEAGEFTIS